MNFKMMQEVETCDANKREEKKVTERVDTEKTNTTKERETKKKEKSRFDQLEELFTDTQLRVDFDDCSWLKRKTEKMRFVVLKSIERKKRLSATCDMRNSLFP